MLTKTQALVLRCTPYGEHAVVARLLTRELGAYAYIIYGIRSKKARITPSMLHPMALLDTEVFHRPDTELQRVQYLQPHLSGLAGYANSMQLLAAGLLAEILSQAIHDHDPQPELFDWLCVRLHDLMTEADPARASLAVLTDLPAWLGFSVDATTHASGRCLYYAEGVFVATSSATHNAQPARGRADQKSDYADPQSSRDMAYYLLHGQWHDDFKATEAYLLTLYGLYARHLPAFRIPRSHDMYGSLLLRQ